MKRIFTLLLTIILWPSPFLFSQAPGIIKNATIQVDNLNTMILAGNPELGITEVQRAKMLQLHIQRLEVVNEFRSSGASAEDKRAKAVETMREVNQTIFKTILTQEQMLAIKAGKEGKTTQGSSPATGKLVYLPKQKIGDLEDTFAPLASEIAPRSIEELWEGYDPGAEPLDVEIIKEWEQEGVVLRIVRYRVGVFKGQKAMMAAVYGFPKGGTNLPALVQIHGGGQYANYKTALANAKRGYATIAIAWAGRIDAPDYRVSPDEVKLFWDNAVDNPDYKVTTDWGAVDAYHAPCRFSNNAFIAYTEPAEWTIDQVHSPRNNGWFLVTVGARRALTFLEHQPEVDPDRLGVYGHSMGGKLTVLTTGTDNRVKVAAPSCGGVSDRHSKNVLFNATIGDHNYLSKINCPIAFLMPSNDFHGRIVDIENAVQEIKTDQWRVTCSPHINHKDNPEFTAVGLLWLDQHLKKNFTFPRTPNTILGLQTEDGIPMLTAQVDNSKEILSVDFFYTQQGEPEKEIRDGTYAINRFWHHAATKENANGIYSAKLPLYDTNRPLWVYANVLYKLDEPVNGVGYYFRDYEANSFNLSSVMKVASAKDLQDNSVKATLQNSVQIESFEGNWEKGWFTTNLKDWSRHTHKVYHEIWKAPANATLAFEVKSKKPNVLVVRVDEHAAEITIPGGDEWQSVSLSPADLKNALEEPLMNWNDIKELSLLQKTLLKENKRGPGEKVNLGKNWVGSAPKFKNLRWEVQ